MNARLTKQRNHAITRIDVLVIVLITVVLFVTLLPQDMAKRRAKRVNCMNNLKEISLALRSRGSDGLDETNSIVESIPAGLNDGQKAWIHALGLSNVLRSQKFLFCPADDKEASTNPPGFPVRINYLLNLDADKTYPQMILSGDDNLAVSVSSIEIDLKPGIVALSSNAPVCWNNERHADTGNIALGDGSVSETGRYTLQRQFQESGLVTNYLAIP